MIMKVALQIFLAAALYFLSNIPSYAIQIDNLYTIVIQVSDNTIETRNQHLPQAFDQVVKKVAGTHDVLIHPEFIAAREHIDRFISTFFYVENEQAYNLTLRFNEPMLNHLLNKMGYTSQLGKDRPQILLWLVLDEQGKRNFVTHSSNSVYANKIDSLSTSYGMPILLPLLDLTERFFITEQDVMDFNIAPLQQAALRYNAEMILLGKATYNNSIWECEWRLVDNLHNISWNGSSVSIDQELESMFNQLGDKVIASRNMVSNYAQNTPGLQSNDLVKAVTKKGITIRVRGVNNLADYAKIFAHLKTLAIAQQVEIGSIEGNQATFIITAGGGKEAIEKALKNDALLSVDFIADNELIYRVNH